MSTKTRTITIPVQGIDCAQCARSLHNSIQKLAGIGSVEVLTAAGRINVRFDSSLITADAIRKAVEASGHAVSGKTTHNESGLQHLRSMSRRLVTLFGFVCGIVLTVVLVGEWLGLFSRLTHGLPWYIWLTIILFVGWPVLQNVLRAARHGRIISHTLMTVGMLAAIAVSEWSAAMIVVFFMRVGDMVEKFTAEHARRAVSGLSAMVPAMARVERNGKELEVPASQVEIGETVVVRPGESIPVDGEVISGLATINQATITGESLPVEAGPGARVYAATLATLGSCRIRATHTGETTVFGRVVRLVEEAEARKGSMQQFADRFSARLLPVIVLVAAGTYLYSRDPLAAAAVLVVVCSCSIALATPMAMIASIGAAARNGILIKGGKYLETLARTDILLIDKTGTLTLGRPSITDIVPLDNLSVAELLTLAASAERYSEHPLGEAVREAAHARQYPLQVPASFEALPGRGIRATISGAMIEIGAPRMFPGLFPAETIRAFEQQGKTVLCILREGHPCGILAATDTLRPEVPEAIAQLRRGKTKRIELLTGDNEAAAAAVAGHLTIAYRANLLPENKIAIVRDYQSRGHTVTMIGDGVNDAPALAQADTGIAMGAAGSDVAIDAAHIALLKEDWLLVPGLFRQAERTLGVVKLNLVFTGIYNTVGILLAAAGLLPLPLAAALQSLPDIGILANSSRLLRRERT